jgi:hypothetical protein
VALRRRPAGGDVKPPRAALDEDRRGERRGKGARDVLGGDREGERKRTVEDASKQVDDIETGAVKGVRDEPGGCPSIGQVVSGEEAARVRSAASARNVGRRTPIPLPRGRARPGVARGSAPGGRNREALSTVAASAGGPARSSGEAPVIGVERRGRLIRRFVSHEQPGRCSGRKRAGMSEPENKSFTISKRLVWEAYERVKANKGAAGVDRQSVEDFEVELRDNLYKIWNRMSSGTYFPPPVLAVEIPKAGGGTRILGVDRGRSGRPDGGGDDAGGPHGVDLP